MLTKSVREQQSLRPMETHCRPCAPRAIAPHGSRLSDAPSRQKTFYSSGAQRVVNAATAIHQNPMHSFINTNFRPPKHFPSRPCHNLPRSPVAYPPYTARCMGRTTCCLQQGTQPEPCRNQYVRWFAHTAARTAVCVHPRSSGSLDPPASERSDRSAPGSSCTPRSQSANHVFLGCTSARQGTTHPIAFSGCGCPKHRETASAVVTQKSSLASVR